MTSMRAISLWQPFASLIAAGAKPFETRSWAPPLRLIGTRIAVHAAARKPTRGELDIIYHDVAEALGFCHWHLRVPYGAVVCTAVLSGAWQVSTCLLDRSILSSGESIKADAFGDYSLGRWCWRLTEIQPFKEPIPTRGAQGFWRWTAPEKADA